MSARRTILAKACPNGHAVVLLRFTDVQAGDDPGDGDSVFVVAGPGDDGDDGVEFESEQAARGFYADEVRRLRDVPNEEAQAAYDAEWGTDNGYAPWQFFHRDC